MRGRVKWFDNARGWGFLVLADGRELFVHHAAISGTRARGFRSLRPGEAVECDVSEGERGACATNVRPLGA